MKKFLSVVAVMSMCWTFSQAETLKNARVYKEIKHDVSLPLRDMAKQTPVFKGIPREVAEPIHFPKVKELGVTDESIVDHMTLPAIGTTDFLNFDGQAADGVAPPDTNGAVGTTQYVQWVNLEYNVYDKTTGSKILGPVQGSSFWSGFGGDCQNNNSGDPIVIFDHLASRWFATQPVFFSSPFHFCIAISTSDDATGSYTRYEFDVVNEFNDYPKWAVWPDGYYASYRGFNTSGTSYKGPRACAADRTAMLAGNAATIQCFNMSSNYDFVLPSDLDGATLPPTGSPNYYISQGDDTNHLNMWSLHIDFVNPANSLLTGPTAVYVPGYNVLCATTRSCVPQPSGGEKLDALSSGLKYRFAYRNFGNYESLLISHAVKASTAATAAVRWYEIRNPSRPKTYQAGTLQDASTSYWMPSMAQDKFGDMAIGFSASSSTVDPSVYYTGRTPNMPLGRMGAPNLVIAGTGVQKSTSNRWGDYAAMQIDPTDDCTFWFTEEYIATTGSFNWSTRINSFKFPRCR